MCIATCSFKCDTNEPIFRKMDSRRVVVIVDVGVGARRQTAESGLLAQTLLELHGFITHEKDRVFFCHQSAGISGCELSRF